jgi:hypothetical protein
MIPDFFHMTSCGHFLKNYWNLWLFIDKTLKTENFRCPNSPWRTTVPFYPKNNKTGLFKVNYYDLPCTVLIVHFSSVWPRSVVRFFPERFIFLWLVPKYCECSRYEFGDIGSWGTMTPHVTGFTRFVNRDSMFLPSKFETNFLKNLYYFRCSLLNCFCWIMWEETTQILQLLALTCTPAFLCDISDCALEHFRSRSVVVLVVFLRQHLEDILCSIRRSADR